MPVYKGSCHCGRVKFEGEFELKSVFECNCSICSDKGAIYVPAQNNQLKITEGGSELSLYQFGTKTASHYFCKHCGIHPFVRPRINPQMWLANIRCLDGVDLKTIKPVLFDGQNWEQSARALVKAK